MPAAVRIVEADSIFSFLAEPQRLVQTDADCIEPWVTRSFVGKVENYIHLFERAECGFWVQEIDEGDDGKVCHGENDPGAVPDVGEGNRCNDDDTAKLLAEVTQIIWHTDRELIIQLPKVLRAFAGPRILNGTIST